MFDRLQQVKILKIAPSKQMRNNQNRKFEDSAAPISSSNDTFINH